jgi:NADH-quinone oxidoreductase subunit J
MMHASALAFYVLSAVLLVSGLLAVTTRRIFRSAIWLLFALVSIAGLYFWMDLEFLAAVQIIIYVGGIVVLIIFSIFLTQQAGTLLPRPPAGRVLFSLLSSLLGFVLTFRLILLYPFQEHPRLSPDISVSAIGTQMLDSSRQGFLLPFELISILLLAAMIGCIVIAMKTHPDP